MAILCQTPGPVSAQNVDNVVQARLLQGWRKSDGTHIAGLHITLESGWKTYWRSPGDAGIPPLFDLSESGNLASSSVLWPRPDVFYQSGMRSIGYHDQVTLPLSLTPHRKGEDITFTARVDIGVCKDICVPKTLTVSAILPASGRKRDARIVAALADRPLNGKQAGARNVTCRIEPTSDGVRITTNFKLAPLGGKEDVVIETANPLLWVGEAVVARDGHSMTAQANIQHVEGAPFIINRDGVRITVLGKSQAVDISGCARN